MKIHNSQAHQLVVGGGAQLQVPQLGVAGGARPQVQLALVQRIGAPEQRQRRRVPRLQLHTLKAEVNVSHVRNSWSGCGLLTQETAAVWRFVRGSHIIRRPPACILRVQHVYCNLPTCAGGCGGGAEVAVMATVAGLAGGL